MSCVARADWIFGSRSSLQHSPALLAASHYLNSPLIVSNHLRNNSCSVYGLYHLLSKLLLLLIISAESTITIYYSYYVIYADFYCQTQVEELFACGKVCACVFWYLLYWVEKFLKISSTIIAFEDLSKLLFLLVEFEDLLKSLLILSLKISQNHLFYWLSLRISQNL